MTAELILDARNATGESPVWSVAEQALYWVDIPARRLHRWQAADGFSQSWKPRKCSRVSPEAATATGLAQWKAAYLPSRPRLMGA